MSIKFSHLFLPLDIEILINSLTKLNYLPLLQNDTVDSSTIFIMNNKYLVEFDKKRNTINLVGRDYNISNILSSILEEIKKEINPMKLKIELIQSIINAHVKGNKNPKEVFGNKKNNLKKEEDFNKIFGEQVNLITMEFFSPNKEIDSNDWYLYKITPLVFQPTILYDI